MVENKDLRTSKSSSDNPASSFVSLRAVTQSDSPGSTCPEKFVEFMEYKKKKQ